MPKKDQTEAEQLSTAVDRLINEQSRAREHLESLERRFRQHAEFDGLTLAGSIETVLKRYNDIIAHTEQVKQQLQDLRKLVIQERQQGILEALDRIVKALKGK